MCDDGITRYRHIKMTENTIFTVSNDDKSRYKTSRLLYIIEAALEYFISIAVGTVYLAKLATHIGISDWLTGILTSFVSLGCAFQIFAVFLGRFKPVKTWVTVFHITSQVLFTGLYFIPAFKWSVAVKTVLFIVMLLFAQIIHNVINAPKINWFMSLVDDRKRGGFTANKEMVSLVGGMLFSYGLGFVFDYFESANQNEQGFIFCGIGLFILMVLHSLTLIFSVEKPAKKEEKVGFKKQFGTICKNKSIFKIVLVATLWNVANYATVSFTGTYQNNELGFSLKFASAIIIVGSLARVLMSKPLGRYADKHSFSKMLCICFIIEAAAFACNIFTVPANGKVMFTIYTILHYMGMAGINSSLINLMYDYVEEEQRVNVLAINQTFYGLAGFLTTLALSPVLALIQENGNQIFGMTIYAQQLFSAFSMIITLILLAYVLKVVNKIKKVEGKETAEENSEQK